MSRPWASIWSATRNGLTSSGPPPGRPNTPPVSPTSASRSGRAGAPPPSVRSTARSRCGSNATTTASSVVPSDSSTVVSSSPATTWAFVTTRSSSTKNPLPSWMREHATPSTLTVERLVDLACDQRAAGLRGHPPLDVGQHRQQQPQDDEDADHADHAPRHLVDPAQRPRRQLGVESGAQHQAQRVPDEGCAHQQTDADEGLGPLV